ncbi:protein disulfide oxidoreductase [Fusibacter sp. JL216-2]|uniref:protein disulfide oxidoreductase n=1 Tax=Fusibacter sp. JL216-2 TaxID=3071453 RepID=UPI003D3439D2
MALLNDELREQLKGILNQMKDQVNVALFTTTETCETCEDTKAFMEEVSNVSDKVVLNQYDIIENKDMADKLGISLTPSIVLLDKDHKDNGIRFNGIPAGHEINSFITGLIEVSGAGEELPEDFRARLDKVDKPVHIKVFVTLGCPHCPGAVSKAHKLALENENITAEMIESQTFFSEAEKYDVSGVPKIIINEDHDIVGNQPIESFMEVIEAL